MPRDVSDREKTRTLKWGPNFTGEPIRAFRSYIPLPPSEVRQFNADVSQMSKAMKHTARQFKRLDKLFGCETTNDVKGSCARACTDPAKYRNLAKTILSSKRCLQAGMWDANARRVLRSRVSTHTILTKATEFKILRNLDEKVTVHTVPKSDGTGARKLNDFGPVARGAQDLTARILRPTYHPRDFQFDHLGSGQKIAKAMELYSKGYTYFAEVDIVKFFQSFERQALEDALWCLPKEAVAQIVVAASAVKVTPSGLEYPPLCPPARPGIPLGSSASVEIAKWSVACMPKFQLGDVVLINHVDNFYLFAKDVKSLGAAIKTLRAAISGCPGGQFEGIEKQSTTLADGFEMLGCDVGLTDGEIIAEPSDRNLKRHKCKFRRLTRAARKALKSTKVERGGYERFAAVVDFLRLQAYAKAWCGAFSVCQGGKQYHDVRNDMNYRTDALRLKYEITEDEERIARRFVGTVRVDGYWF